jgi:RND family efflux transporter MFP subunit
MRPAALLLGLAAAAGCGDERSAALVRPAPRDGGAGPAAAGSDANSAAAETGDRGFIGVLVTESATIAAGFDGTLLDVRVRYGDTVAAGDVVAEMDPRPLQDDLRAALADERKAHAAVRRAAVDVKTAERELKASLELVKIGSVAQKAVDDARLALDRALADRAQAGAEVDAARSRVQIARNRLDNTRLRARFAGKVKERHHDRGHSVRAGDPIVSLVGEGVPFLRFAVPPDRVRDVAVGTRLRVDVEAVKEPLGATVSHVSPAVDGASEMIPAEAALDDAPAALAGLRSGLAAWVRPAR